jgi:hypothetical protein
MGRYSVGATRTVGTAANQPQFQLRNTGTAERLFVVEIGINVGTTALAAAQSMYLARSTATGTQTATVAGLPNDTSDGATNGSVDTAFSANPTFSTTAFLRKGGLPSAIGSQIIWTFYDKPLVIPNTTASGLVIANVAAVATGIMECYFTWDE